MEVFMSQKNGTIKQLLDFLDKKAFNPILNKSEDDFKSEIEKRNFHHVRRSTQSEKERFHTRYHSAEEIKSNYLDDLNSSAAKKIDPIIESLGLPSLPQFRDEFIQLCNSLGVK
jgi:hypothetical protein